MENLSNYKNVEINSKNCVEDSIFICFKTRYINNYKYIEDAIDNGATLVIAKKGTKIKSSVKIIYVNDIDSIFKYLLNYFYPLKQIKIIGVTGTDGKTTTSLMIHSLINQVDNCGYIGTNGIMYNNEKFSTINTTPDPVTIRKYLYTMENNNVNYVAIECSSEGILYNRISSLEFDILIYTNISREHLNTHKTMKKYLSTKLKLISQLKNNGIILVNNDDEKLNLIKGKSVIRYGLNGGDCYAFNIKYNFNNTSFEYKFFNTKNTVTAPFFGDYNLYNFLATISVLHIFNLITYIDLSILNKIDGRFERISKDDKEIVIDFAHTPNALDSLLKNIKFITSKKIILVMGSGGNKDKSKRPLLGEVAQRYANHIIITSEDPKDELITNIFFDIVKKIKKEYYLVPFRKDAIKLGISLLDKDSILVIVGKGLENYEQIYNIKFKYNDFEYTYSLLNS